MAKYKYVYTVNHSEQGILGVYTSPTLAMEKAMEYVSSNGWKMIESRDEHYQHLCAKGWVLIEANPMKDVTSLEIEIQFVDVKESDRGCIVFQANHERIVNEIDNRMGEVR